MENHLTFDPSLRYIGDYDWILRIIAQLRIKRLNLYFSEVRVHPAQGSTRYREAMIEEHQRVVKAHHINPVPYKLFTSLFVIVQDAEKLRYAWSQAGFRGVWHLIANHYRRHKSPD